MMLIGMEWWVAAIVATILAFAISYIFFSEPREALARDIHERRNSADRDVDSEIENALLDRSLGDDKA